MDLLAPLVRQGSKPITAAAVPGDAAFGRIQPMDYKAMVKADNSWVYTCARINAQNVAKATLRLFKKNKTGDKEEIFDHPILDILRNVNPTMNKFDLMELTDLYQELTGNAYWYLMPSRLINPKTRRSVPLQIWPLMSQFMRIVPGKERFVDGFLYQPPGVAMPIAFDASEIIHFRFPSADSMYYGKGPLEGARFAADSNEFQKRYEIGLFRNMARPDGILSTEKDLTGAQVRKLRIEWRKLYGGPARAGNIAILQRGMSYEKVAANPKELDYLRGRIATREEIMSTFGVPESKVGLMEDTNRSNGEAADVTYQGETIYPRLIRMHEKLNEQFTPIYDDVLIVEYDNPVPRDREHLLKKRNECLDRAVITINEVREEDGLDPVPWGDKPLVDANKVPLGEAPPAAPGDDPDDTEDPDDVKGHWARVLTKGTDERKNAWKKYINAIAPIERRIKKIMGLYFTEQRRIVERNIDKVRGYKAVDPLVDTIMFSTALEDERLFNLAHPEIEKAVTAGATVGGASLPHVDFDVLNPAVAEAVKERTKFFSTHINKTTAKVLTATIEDGIVAGETITQIAARVQDVYDKAIGFRSIRIARTETISASNVGTIEAYKAGGATKKQWVTASDEFVRSSHALAEGQTVGINQKFQVGAASLSQPGDPDGPPGEIINCRCTTLPILER